MSKVKIQDHIYPPLKAIRIPPNRLVDVSNYLPIINHPRFQLLDNKTQVGLVSKVFRGATHTRFLHSVSTLDKGQQSLNRFKIFDDPLRHAILSYALIHDIGHGPFSHQTEPLLESDHNQQGLIILEEMKDAVSQCADFELVRELLAHENPYHQIVSNKNLGADKLAYLFHDAYYMGFSNMPDINNLILYSVFVDGKLALEEKNIDEIKEAQRFFSYIHTRGYLRKQSLINQRILQRALEESMKVDGYGEKEIWNMVDADLEFRLNNSKCTLARELSNRIRYRGDTLVTAAVFRVQGALKNERIAKKNIYAKELPVETVKKFMDKYDTPYKLTQFENELSAEFGISKGRLLVAAMPFFERIIPKDVLLYSQKTGETDRLFERDNLHYQQLYQTYTNSFAIRLATTQEDREKVEKLGPKINQYILEKIEHD